MARFTGMMIDGEGDYDSLVAAAVQAAVASPAVVNTPANVAPSPSAVEKVVTAVIKAIAPDDSDARLSQIAKQATQAVVTNPAVIKSPAGQTVTPAVVNTIATTVVKAATNDSAASVMAPVVDEQTKAAGMRAAAATVPAATAAIAKTPDELMVEKLQAQILKSQASVGSLQNIATELGALNPSAMTKAEGETNTQFNARVKKAEAAARTAAAAENPLLNKASKPTDAPPGKYYAWIGGTDTGQWKLYDIPGYGVSTTTGATGATGGATGATGGATGATGGATGDTGPTLASDVFKQTLAVFFGPTEMAKPWANELYKAVSKFYKQGATSEEAFNMALLESETNPAMTDFTKRFKGIFALQKMKQAGKAVTVPTVAEYFATESKMGDILKASNLGELANEEFLGDVLSKGINATQFGDRIVNIFDRIDTAPDAIKKTISRFFPTLDRVQLAKALATGDKGAKQLQQELTGYEVLSAAEQQGLGVSSTLPSGITNERAQQIARGGGTFASTLGQFGQIASARETEQKLAEISGMKSLGVSGLTSAVIDKSATELKKLEDLTRGEESRFAGKAGTIGSKSLASSNRAKGII